MRRMNTQRQGLLVSLENENTNTDSGTASENDVEVAEAGAELSDDVAEIVDSVAEGDADTAEVEEATEVAEALESIAEAVGVCAQNGGLDRHAAHAIGLAVGHMYNRVGLEAQAMPALESFGSSSQRIPSTSLAMEDIKEQAGKIWNHIVEAVKRAIKWAQDFYNKLFGAAEKLSKRASALQTKAEGITGGKAKEASFENEKLVKALHVNGKVPTALGAALGKVGAIGRDCFGEASDWALKVGSEITADMEKEGAEKTFLESFELPAGGLIGAEVSNAEGAGFAAPADGLVIYRSEEMPGGMAVAGAGTKNGMKGEAAVDAFRGVGQKVQPFDPKAKAPADKKVTTLTTRDMVETCKAVATLAEEIKKFRDGQAKLNEMKKKFQSASEKLAKKASSGDEGRDGLRAMAKVAGKLPSLVDNPAASFSAYAINTCKAALDYVDASTKQYASA